jgi:hypothetical protein
VIRIRRCEPTGTLRRRLYEVELVDQGSGVVAWREESSTPVTLIDPYGGVAEAWALVRSADEHWGRGSTEWISLSGSDKG